MTVGPIIFSNEQARQHLLEEGSVITFRNKERTTGETHVRYSRTGKKQFDCHVLKHADVSGSLLDEELEAHYRDAGFESAAEWKDAIRELHGSVPESGYLYQVTVDDPSVTATDGGRLDSEMDTVYREICWGLKQLAIAAESADPHISGEAEAQAKVTFEEIVYSLQHDYYHE